MTLGEKLTSLECMIFDFANARLTAAKVDETLAEVVMGNVHRKFLEGAYHKSLLNQMIEKQSKAVTEERSGTAEDLMKEMGENGVVSGMQG